MNLKDILAQVAERNNLTQKQTREVYDSLIEVVSEELAKEETDKLSLTNFVTFYKKQQDARVGRNPQTGEPIQIPAKTKLSIKPTSNMKAVV